MNKTKTICNLALGIALYVVLSATVKIPLISHIQTDLGYVAFGFYLVLFGWKASVVGVIGCIIESIIYVGWFPFEWALGQLLIGVFCGILYQKTECVKEPYKTVFRIVITIFALFVGIILIKTIVGCYIWSLPFGVKVAKKYNCFYC